jgi:hypothetical protein
MSIISTTLRVFRNTWLIAILLAVAALATISLDSARAEYPDHQIAVTQTSRCE